MPPHEIRRRQLWKLFGIVALVGGIGIGLRMHSAWALREETQDAAITLVRVIEPKKATSSEEIVLPGNVQAWHEATIYAHTNGYVKNWYTSFGTHVKEGELMAEIETPDVDAQLRQAEADLNTAEANNVLAQTTAKRWLEMLKTDSVAKQGVDEKVAAAAVAAAEVASARANRDRLKELSGFERIVAPFDGVVTSRTLDIGMLVGQASGAPDLPLFHIVQADRLRVYVKVPQNDAARITPDVAAQVHLVDHPGENYPAKLYKSAGAIDPASRTLLAEFLIENKDEKLLSGGYAEVHIQLSTSDSNMRLPINALIFRADGLQVATLDGEGKVTLQKITAGRDFGNEMEVRSGITAEDKIIINPPDSLHTGQVVRLIETPAPKEEKK